MLRIRRALAVAGALAMVFALAACTGTSTPSGNTTGGGASAGGNTVSLQNIAFNPSSLTVNVGDTVTFKNDDSVEHHIVVGTDDLGVQQPGESKTWKAPADGVYMMKCLIHPSMNGQITVGAGGSTVGTPSSGGGSMGATSGVPGY